MLTGRGDLVESAGHRRAQPLPARSPRPPFDLAAKRRWPSSSAVGARRSACDAAPHRRRDSSSPASNRGKVREIAALLAPFGARRCVSTGALGLDEPEETGKSFVANAELKARAAATASGLPALSDNSGLVVSALGGAPGIHSARWGGEGRDFGLAMRKVEEALGGKSDRRAHFVCALSLCWPDGT